MCGRVALFTFSCGRAGSLLKDTEHYEEGRGNTHTKPTDDDEDESEEDNGHEKQTKKIGRKIKKKKKKKEES